MFVVQNVLSSFKGIYYERIMLATLYQGYKI